MSTIFSTITPQQLTELSHPIQQLLSKTPYNPPKSHDVSVKSFIQSLLPPKNPENNTNPSKIIDFSLCCAFLSASNNSNSLFVNWVTPQLSNSAKSAFRALSKTVFGENGDCDVNLSLEQRLVIELMPKVLPLIKDKIKESSVSGSDDGDEISAASSRAPLAYAVVAAYQLRWFVTQVESPHLGKMCGLIVPCGLTALDHWSPEVKGQGMISFIHIAKHINAAELGGYGDVILDACRQNIVSTDELWHDAIEMSVLLVTCLQKHNPRSPWFEKFLNEMLGHLERQPKNKERRVAWLKLIEPLFFCVGLVLLAHFRSLFPLFFQWMHADDDETVLLVLERLLVVVKLTWIRRSPYTARLVDELAILYKEAATRVAREDIRKLICQITILLQQCKGVQFEATWEKYKDDPNLEVLAQSVAEQATLVA
ncbi:hypothetical protein RND81_10G137900 [Saponaria officinalis]|uniref:ARM repeat superfamily protein n=1 Tax=Saponaria officinalis TaxID=3572 RepID=A0AAW1I473_SAPOF